MIFNSHSHINDATNPQELILRAKDNNVTKIAVVGYDVESSIRAINLANQYENVYAICGISPQEVENFNEDYSNIEKMLDNPKCIALGEIGLDYYYGKETKEKQLRVFEDQIKIAILHNKPIAIHCRDAYLDTYELLNKYHKELKGILLHCYSGSKEMAKRYLDLGAYISFSGVVTFKNAKEIVEVASMCPIDRIIVETDDPYLSPVPLRGTTNEPKNVRLVLEKIEEIRNEKIEDKVYENTLRFFGL